MKHMDNKIINLYLLLNKNYMMKNYAFFVGIILLCISCKTQNADNYNYLKDIEKVALENSIKNNRNTIQPGDQLVILVSAKDMDVVAPFNKSYSSTTTITQYSSPSSNSLPQSLPITGPTYTVDTNNNIMFPEIGLINTKDLNIEGLRDKLVSELTRYIKNPSVDIKNINFRVAVGGEVVRPGTYIIPDGNATTILNALTLAGDLTMYGVRKDILVLRNVDGQITYNKIDLTSADFVNSPYFYLKQNDYVYVPANKTKEKTSKQNPNTVLYISAAGVVVSAIGIIIALTK